MTPVSTIQRMREACARVDCRDGSAPGSYIEACRDVADVMVAEVVASIPTEGALTVAEVALVNRERCRRWHGGESEPWSGADWSNAMGGEVGEVAEALEALTTFTLLAGASGKAGNVVKKMRRRELGTGAAGDPGAEQLHAMLADELADVVLYLLLLADHYSIDVPTAVASKFNRTSEAQGFPERLQAQRA